MGKNQTVAAVCFYHNAHMYFWRIYRICSYRSYILTGERQFAVYRYCFSVSECPGLGMPHEWDCSVLSTDWIHKKIQFNDCDQCDWTQYAAGESGSRYQSELYNGVLSFGCNISDWPPTDV